MRIAVPLRACGLMVGLVTGVACPDLTARADAAPATVCLELLRVTHVPEVGLADARVSERAEALCAAIAPSFRAERPALPAGTLQSQMRAAFAATSAFVDAHRAARAALPSDVPDDVVALAVLAFHDAQSAEVVISLARWYEAHGPDRERARALLRTARDAAQRAAASFARCRRLDAVDGADALARICDDHEVAMRVERRRLDAAADDPFEVGPYPGGAETCWIEPERDAAHVRARAAETVRSLVVLDPTTFARVPLSEPDLDDVVVAVRERLAHLTGLPFVDARTASAAARAALARTHPGPGCYASTDPLDVLADAFPDATIWRVGLRCDGRACSISASADAGEATEPRRFAASIDASADPRTVRAFTRASAALQPSPVVVDTSALDAPSTPMTIAAAHVFGGDGGDTLSPAIDGIAGSLVACDADHEGAFEGMLEIGRDGRVTVPRSWSTDADESVRACRVRALASLRLAPARAAGGPTRALVRLVFTPGTASDLRTVRYGVLLSGVRVRMPRVRSFDSRLSPSTIARMVEPVLARCHARVTPEAASSVLDTTVRVTTGTDGRATEIAVETASADLRACLEREISALRFPCPASSASVHAATFELRSCSFRDGYAPTPGGAPF